MSLWLAALVAVVVTALAVGAMLLMRRHAPAGGYFEDGDRAAGVFGVIATGFAVLAGFVVFLAFESFDTSRSGAETEARTVAQQFETAQFLPDAMRARVSGELVCYARAVVHREWPRMQSGTLGEAPNPWGVAVFRSLGTAEPRSPSEQAAFSKYLDQRADRETARGDRIHGAEGVIPTALWAVLFVSAAAVFVFLLMFADSGERAAVQGVMMGGAILVVTSLLLVLSFLDNPYRDSGSGLQPVAMEHTLSLLAEEARIGGGVDGPCDRRGLARGAGRSPAAPNRPGSRDCRSSPCRGVRSRSPGCRPPGCAWAACGGASARGARAGWRGGSRRTRRARPSRRSWPRRPRRIRSA